MKQFIKCTNKCSKQAPVEYDKCLVITVPNYNKITDHVRCGGSKSASLLRTFADRWSGNWTSNSTKRSPRFVRCFGYGRPSPRILRTAPGFITESLVFSCTVRPLSVGTSMVVPINACKQQHVTFK